MTLTKDGYREDPHCRQGIQNTGLFQLRDFGGKKLGLHESLCVRIALLLSGFHCKTFSFFKGLSLESQPEGLTLNRCSMIYYGRKEKVGESEEQ